MSPQTMKLLTEIFAFLSALAAGGLFVGLRKVRADLKAHKGRSVLTQDFVEIVSDIVSALPAGAAAETRAVLTRLRAAAGSGAKVILPLLIALGILAAAAAPARAGGLAISPTIPLSRVDLSGPAAGKVSLLAKGAGLAVTYGFAPTVISGRSWDLLDLGAAVFAEKSAVTLPGLGSLALSGALYGCSLNDLVCLGLGRDFLPWSQGGTFLLLSVGFQIGLQPSQGVAGSSGAVFAEPEELPPGNQLALP